MQSSNLNQSLMQYESILKALADNKSDLTDKDILSALIIRDKIQKLIDEKTLLTPDTILRLIEIDNQLKILTPRITQVVDFEKWRISVMPPPAAWWWFLDGQIAEHKKRNVKLQYILAGTLIALSLPLVVEIVRRFLVGAPDTISIWGILLTLLLTASPFVKEGRETIQGLLERLPFVKPNHTSEIMIILSILVLSVLLIARLWLLPGPLTTYYNNAGIGAREAGNLNLARQMFQRAAALNPDRVVPYYNLAEAYQDIGLEEKAADWYQIAIEHDENFVIAYRGLGELYNRQSEFVASEKVLLAGLSIPLNNKDEVTEKVARYELLSNLGWSYWGQNKLELAQDTFISALALEPELMDLGAARNTEFRSALPHFYLAQIYEQTGEIDRARQQWEESLRLLDQSNWHQREQYKIAQQHLQLLTGK